MNTWKERLSAQMPTDLAEEIDVFETQMEQKRLGQLDDKLFGESRLRRGVYGQRYDNGQRNDGNGTKTLEFPCGDLTKGVDTVWDAPGMVRIKIPFGGMSAEQMEVLADLAEEVSDGISHITTRQDIQLHYVHIDDTPDMMRRLAAVGITTREACGNSVRNVTACPIAGVCREESFDVTPYADATMRFLLGHPDVQDFGRKFKIALSGCAQNACGLVNLHDLGLIAVTKEEGGQTIRGFQLYVGGGLGAVPHDAKLFDDFVPETEILPLMQAVSRVFARLGEKRNRARARIKFLVKKLGIDEFRRLVLEERAQLPVDERWTSLVSKVPEEFETPLRPAAPLEAGDLPEGFADWRRTNVYAQRQEGYFVATVTLPMGDITSRQLRALADVARKYVGDAVRTTVEQNLVLRWVSEADLPDLYRDLAALDLAQAGAETVVDLTACPGTDTCKLGIASSRGLARELRNRMMAKRGSIDPGVEKLRIKTSGCFNSCGQHHVADLGFYGVSRKVGGVTVPHFQVVVGGKWQENGGSYGLAVGAVPSKRIPDVVERLTSRWVDEREQGESFQDFIQRIGKAELRSTLEPFSKVPPYEEDRSYYSDWGDPREFTLGDMGKGECAGEVVSLFDFDIAAAEREVFEAQIKLDEKDADAAEALAYKSMLSAARGLVKMQFLDVSEDPEVIVSEFRKRYFDTQIFHDKYAGGKFANYLFRRHEEGSEGKGREGAHHLIEEAQLFIEAAHACHGRVLEQGQAAPA